MSDVPPALERRDPAARTTHWCAQHSRPTRTHEFYWISTVLKRWRLFGHSFNSGFFRATYEDELESPDEPQLYGALHF